MIIKNNKPKGQYFHYKIGGKILKYFIKGFESVDIKELTEESQIISNTFERRLRHIEDKFGYNFKTAFEEPGDPDFPTFTIVASSSALGTISPAGNVKVAIYNMLGQEVKVLVNEFQKTGNYSIKFNGADYASGMYIYRMQSGEFNKTIKMMLLK